jgi:hypothetical protein
MSDRPAVRFVAHLPDLMTGEDYREAHRRKVLRFRLAQGGQGLEILGDSPYPDLLEELLAALGPGVIEMMLCG